MQLQLFAAVTTLVAALGMARPAQCAEPAAAAVATAPVVLELFTSQGCSSCPAADKLFKEFVGRDGIIAISLPVDYWDYLGWKDTLASPKFSKRQRAYAKRRGDGRVYTPQMVIDGRQHFVGSARAEIESALKAPRADVVSGLVAHIDQGTISIALPQAPRAIDDATVWLAVVRAEVKVEVRSGENLGRALSYYNVVRDLLPLGMWSGGPATIKQHVAALPGESGDRYAVLVQQGIGGPILAAAWAKP